MKIAQVNAQGRNRSAGIRHGEAGGIHASAFPEIYAARRASEVTQGDIGLGGRFMPALDPAGDGCGGDAEALGEGRLGQIQVAEEPLDPFGPIRGRGYLLRHL